MKKAYFTRSDLQDVHMFKMELIDKETHIREDHPHFLNRKAAPQRRPRNVLLAEPTPRSRPGTHDVSKYKPSGVLSQNGRSIAGSGSSSISASGNSKADRAARSREVRAPGGATLYDLAYTSSVSGMRRQANAKMRELEHLMAIQARVDKRVESPSKNRTQEYLRANPWLQSETGVESGFATA
jgi:hypothetical protein